MNKNFNLKDNIIYQMIQQNLNDTHNWKEM